MNKLLLVSLAFMVILAIVSMASGSSFSTLSQEYNASFSGKTDGTSTSHSFAQQVVGSFSDAPAFILFTMAVLGLALLGGWSVLGSGPSEVAGTAIFQGGAFMSIYALLSSFSWSFFSSMGSIGTYAWLGVTFFYAIGTIEQSRVSGE